MRCKTGIGKVGRVNPLDIIAVDHPHTGDTVKHQDGLQVAEDAGGFDSKFRFLFDIDTVNAQSQNLFPYRIVYNLILFWNNTNSQGIFSPANSRLLVTGQASTPKGTLKAGIPPLRQAHTVCRLPGWREGG